MPDSAAAEDFLQDTYLVLWEKFDQYQPDTNFFAWAREIARNKLMNFLSKQKKGALTLDPHAMEDLLAVSQPCGETLDEHRRRAVAHCLGELRAEDRALIQRRYQPDVEVKSLAAELSRTPNALSKVLGRVRSQIYDCVTRVLDREGEEWS